MTGRDRAGRGTCGADTVRIAELRQLEVINLCDGTRLGWVGDVEIDLTCGRLTALIVPGPCRFFGLFGPREEYVVPWDAIEKIGDDIILVRYDAPRPGREREKEKRFSCFRL